MDNDWNPQLVKTSRGYVVVNADTRKPLPLKDQRRFLELLFGSREIRTVENKRTK